MALPPNQNEPPNNWPVGPEEAAAIAAIALAERAANLIPLELRGTPAAQQALAPYVEAALAAARVFADALARRAARP